MSLDQLGNTILGGASDETFSSRSARANRAGRWWGIRMCKILGWFEPDHCEKAIESELQGHQTSQGIRDLLAPDEGPKAPGSTPVTPGKQENKNVKPN